MLKSTMLLAAGILMSVAVAAPVAAFAGDNDDQPASCHDNCRIIVTDDIPPDAPTSCHDNCTIYVHSIDDATCHDRCQIIDRDQDDHVSDDPGSCHNDCAVVGHVDGASCHDKCVIVGQKHDDSDSGHGKHGKGDRWASGS